MKDLILESIEHGFTGLNPETAKGPEGIDLRVNPDRVNFLQETQLINLLGRLTKADNPCSQKAGEMLKKIAKEGRQHSHQVLARRALAGNGFLK